MRRLVATGRQVEASRSCSPDEVCRNLNRRYSNINGLQLAASIQRYRLALKISSDNAIPLRAGPLATSDSLAPMSRPQISPLTRILTRGNKYLNILANRLFIL